MHSILDQIGLEKGTDKASNKNDFLRRYERLVSRFQYQKVRVLEIGVFDGASVRVWKDYFRSGTIIGADINPEASKHEEDRISIEIIDQGSEQDLDRLATLGPFDLIVDDGSHLWIHQILTFRKLIVSLKPGGLFIIEDLDTSYGKYKRDYGSFEYITTADFLKKVADWIVGAWVLEPVCSGDDFLNKMSQELDFVMFTRGAAIIKKR